MGLAPAGQELRGQEPWGEQAAQAAHDLELRMEARDLLGQLAEAASREILRMDAPLAAGGTVFVCELRRAIGTPSHLRSPRAPR